MKTAEGDVADVGEQVFVIHGIAAEIDRIWHLRSRLFRWQRDAEGCPDVLARTLFMWTRLSITRLPPALTVFADPVEQGALETDVLTEFF